MSGFRTSTLKYRHDYYRRAPQRRLHTPWPRLVVQGLRRFWPDMSLDRAAHVYKLYVHAVHQTLSRRQYHAHPIQER